MADPQVVSGLLGLAAVVVSVLLTQTFLHRRWAREQDTKREHAIDKAAEIRRLEQAEVLDRMAEQNSKVVENAVRLAEVHQGDAEKARVLALESVSAHTECRQEVARLSGQVESLRDRIIENERTYGQDQLMSERHRDLKHQVLQALTVSEGYVGLVQQRVKNCTCSAFDPLEDITAGMAPRLGDLLEKNKHLARETQ